MNPFRQKLISIVTFLGGIYFFLVFLLPKRVFGVAIDAYDEQILKAVQIVGIMSIGLGIINLFSVYGRIILKEKKGRVNAGALLVGFSVMFTVLLIDLIDNERVVSARQSLQALQIYTDRLQAPITDPNSANDAQRYVIIKREAQKIIDGKAFVAPDAAENPNATLATDSAFLTAREALRLSAERVVAADTPSMATVLVEFSSSLKALNVPYGEMLKHTAEEGLASKIQQLLYEGFFVPLSSAIFALLAFYIATAAYRAFRIKTLESTVMMLAALLVILGQIPHGPIYISESLPAIRLWLLENISTPAFRAIYFGSTVAGLAMAVRMWLSLEANQISRDEP